MAVVIKAGIYNIVVEMVEGQMHAHFQGIVPHGVGATRNDSIDDLAEKFFSIGQLLRAAKHDLVRREHAGTETAISRADVPKKALE